MLNRNAVDEEVMTVLNEIGDLANVVITSATNDDILIYNGTKWVNITKTAFLTAVNSRIDDIKDGTTIVSKATGDKDGNPIDITYLKKSGGTMAGTINMGAQKIINMADGVNASEAGNQRAIRFKRKIGIKRKT